MRRALFAASVLVGLCARAHDLGVDVSGTFTRSSSTNPRVGSLGVGASGAYDFNDAWSLTGLVLYTRDLATRTAESSSPGSNVFLLNLGVMWLPTESLMTMLSVVGSPPSQQENATTITTRTGNAFDVVVTSRNWSVGATWNGLWSSNGLSNFEHTVELGAGFNRFNTYQQLTTPNSARIEVLRAACQTGLSADLCRLVLGVTTPLLQGRFNVGYTATLFRKTDMGIDAAYFLYDRPPSSVGYFSLLAFNQTELGNGVPISPLLLTVRGHASHQFGPVTVRLSYQFGLYTESLGALHVVTARVTVKVNEHWRLGFTLTGQGDVTLGVVNNLGGQGLAGVTYVF